MWLFRQPQSTPNETGMSRIRGLAVRAMTGEVVPTRRTRGRRAAWFIFQREEPTPHRRCRHAQVIFPTAATATADAASAAPVSGNETDSNE